MISSTDLNPSCSVLFQHVHLRLRLNVNLLLRVINYTTDVGARRGKVSSQLNFMKQLLSAGWCDLRGAVQMLQISKLLCKSARKHFKISVSFYFLLYNQTPHVSLNVFVRMRWWFIEGKSCGVRHLLREGQFRFRPRPSAPTCRAHLSPGPVETKMSLPDSRTSEKPSSAAASVRKL